MASSGHVEDLDGYVYGDVANGSHKVLFGSLLNTLARFEKEDEEARAREELSPDLMPCQSLSPTPMISCRFLPSTVPARLENRCSQSVPGNKIFGPQSTKRKSSNMSHALEDNLQDWSTPQKRPKLQLRGGRGSSSLESCSRSTSTTEYQTPEDVDAALRAQLNSEEDTTLKKPTPKGRVDKSAVYSQSNENRSEDAQQSEEDEPRGEVGNEDWENEEPQSDGNAREERNNNRPRKKLKKSRLVVIRAVLEPAIKVESDDEDQSSSTSCVVEAFRADRQTPTGLEILVEWQDYPKKADWTWESEEKLLGRVPEMVTAWHARTPEEENKDNENAEDLMILEVDEIVGRRRKKGTFWYNVSWKGYPLKKDRTWEPYETLHADVPFLVEAYDRKQQKSVKRKR